MKLLILGAGAVGGYFGGRLVQAGADVTFLVRPQRAQKLAQAGLVIKSPLGDAQIPVRTLLQEAVRPDYDLVMLSCKAYDLDASIAAIGAAMGPNTLILPLLNGMAQLARLEQAFGGARVLGGTCYIASTLDADGSIRHLSQFQGITCGPRPGSHAHAGTLLQQLAQAYARVSVECKLSAEIEQDMWEKFVLLASLAAMTCLMRASVGEILTAADGEALMRAALSSCVAAAGAAGHAPRAESLQRTESMLFARGSAFTASMLRDIEAGGRVEADHIVGDMLRRARAAGADTGLLAAAYCHLQAYEARRLRGAPG
ncbi:MAG: 2-dehydropantoate 2-reductase [Betaproteobacteria bacterium RIFCSPLOWO2_12_FULL_64_23]|nr:MAG: 2-dehydropantoate 2-reductase [Betaproteobacteria bacterium RIFCSPLOWO2_12_FULL_64_23]